MKIIKPHPAIDALDPSHSFNSDRAVFATPYAVAAVAFACVNRSVIPESIKEKKGSQFSLGYYDGEVRLTIPDYFQEYVDEFKGYVYILNEKSTVVDSWQVKLYNEARPLETIEVAFDDFKKLGGKVEFVSV